MARQITQKEKSDSSPDRPDYSNMTEILHSQSTKWSFLTNHAHVLILLNQEPDMILREVAARIGITERAVQKIVHDLKEDGFIKLEKIGRQNHYIVSKELPFRHPIESHLKIGKLLNLLEGEQ